jgi:adenylyltransferase/sulfurtransferase
MYLAGAGIGTLGIVDGDSVDISNLHRQLIHPEANAGLNKAESAKRQISAINSSTTVHV